MEPTKSKLCGGAELPDLPENHYAHNAILLQNTFLYVIGGKEGYFTSLGKNLQATHNTKLDKIMTFNLQIKHIYLI